MISSDDDDMMMMMMIMMMMMMMMMIWCFVRESICSSSGECGCSRRDRDLERRLHPIQQVITAPPSMQHTYLSTYLSIHLSIYLSIHINRSIHIYLSICHLSIAFLSSICLSSICLSSIYSLSFNACIHAGRWMGL